LANYPGCHGKCKDVERSWPMAMVHGSIGASPQKRRPTHVPKLSPLITPDKCPRTTPPTNHAHTHCTPPDAGRIPAQTVHPPSPLCASQTPAPRRAPTTMSNRYVHPPRQQLPLYTRRLHAPRFSRPGAQNDLFSSYNRSASPSKDKKKPRSPYAASPYSGAGASSYAFPSSSPAPESPSFGAYPGANAASANGSGTFRSATPNSRGQYSAATLDELESQNDDQAGVLISKVKMLKDVRAVPHSLSTPVYAG
jgi:hypothetical protein